MTIACHVPGAVAGAEQVRGNVLQAGRPQEKCGTAQGRGVLAYMSCSYVLRIHPLRHAPEREVVAHFRSQHLHL